MNKKATMGMALAGLTAGVGILVYLVLNPHSGEEVKATKPDILGSVTAEAHAIEGAVQAQREATLAEMESMRAEFRSRRAARESGKKQVPLETEVAVAQTKLQQAQMQQGNPAPFGFELGKTLYAEVAEKLGPQAQGHKYSDKKKPKKKRGLDLDLGSMGAGWLEFKEGRLLDGLQKEVNEHYLVMFGRDNPQGRYLQIDGSKKLQQTLGLEGALRVYLFFDRAEALAGVLVAMKENEFIHSFKVLTEKYALVEHNVSERGLIRHGEHAVFAQNEVLIKLQANSSFEMPATLFYALKPYLEHEKKQAQAEVAAREQAKRDAL